MDKDERGLLWLLLVFSMEIYSQFTICFLFLQRSYDLKGHTQLLFSFFFFLELVPKYSVIF